MTPPATTIGKITMTKELERQLLQVKRFGFPPLDLKTQQKDELQEVKARRQLLHKAFYDWCPTGHCTCNGVVCPRKKFQPRPQITRIREPEADSMETVISETPSLVTVASIPEPPKPPVIEAIHAEFKPLKPIPNSTGRRVFLVRCAERADVMFPRWPECNFTGDGKYFIRDLNEPRHLQQRPDGVLNYKHDALITELGGVMAQMVARSLLATGVVPKFVVVSPAIRCVQTAKVMMHYFASDVTGCPKEMCVEPALSEYLGWYQPRRLILLNAEQLKDMGYDVDTSYEPRLNTMELLSLTETKLETCYERHADAMEWIKRKLMPQDKSGDMIIVTHAVTIDALMQALLKQKPEVEPNVEALGSKFPYCCVVGLEERSDGEWQMLEKPCLPLTDFEFTNATNDT